MLNVVQNIVMPNLVFGAPEEMYIRACNLSAHVHLQERFLVFKKGGQVKFDTFFNSFSISVWRKYCQLQDLYFVIKGSGKFILRFGLHSIGHSHRWLTEQIVDCKQGNDVIIELPFWKDLNDGMLYFYLEALTEATFTGGFFATSTLPAQNIKLGIVVTHFNRKQYVIPAIQRINDQLLNAPLYKGNIDLIVVDNSKTISAQEGCGVTIIPNKNLGGSGGFARGLLHLKDEGSFTHCLFMDDDASCEVESIRRCYHLLQFSIKERFAVSGALLHELEPFMLHEKGGGFRGCNWAFTKSGLNLTKIDDLLYSEKEEFKVDYGGWWFFAFKIADVNSLPFPFFVRGDDTLFGLQNNFTICTINGIGCWAEDFSHKESPITRYLGARAHLLLGLGFGKASLLVSSKIICRWFLSSLFSYNYASAKAVRLALTHVLIGEKFWVDNIDASGVCKQIADFSASERLVSINRANLNFVYPPIHGFKLKYPQLKPTQIKCFSKNESLMRKLVRILTLNGFLLPSFALKNHVIFQHKNFSAVYSEIFLYKEVFYELVPTGQGYITVHNKAKFFIELFAFCRQLTLFAIHYRILRIEYTKAIAKMTSESFWRKIYADE